MRVIDFHAHYFGRVFFETLAAQSPLEGDIATKARGGSLNEPASSFVREQLRARGALGVRARAPRGRAHVRLRERPGRSSGGVRGARESRWPPDRVRDRQLPRVEGPGREDPRAARETRDPPACLLFPAMHNYAIGGSERKPITRALDDHDGVVRAHAACYVVKRAT